MLGDTDYGYEVREWDTSYNPEKQEILVVKKNTFTFLKQNITFV